MGAFDDAIREHLELKRRQGVSEEELKRQEEEALGRGAVRFARPETTAALPGQGQPLAAGEAADGQAAAETQAAADRPDEAAATQPEKPAETPETARAALAEPDEVAPEEPAAPAREDQPAPPAVDDELEPDEVLPDESLEPSVEDDLLEETPDFLEESPDQDRLWFEQRAPKDFDFGD